ncbi:MAG: SDR family oxidoreductase [Hyphomicrobiaceae bacterium]|nr:MAG: SDR family oxidoreductase [Hyphomicrobiaceae bacterium]
MKPVLDKVALVTGAASGIGQACARRLLADGSSVALVDRELCDTLGHPPARALAIQADVAEEQGLAAAVAATVDAFGRLDILINSAGIIARGSTADMPSPEWHRVLAVDLSSMFFAARVALPHLGKRGGAIVNVASVAGSRGSINAAYDAAKGGVIALTRRLAGEFAPLGVRVNSVSPGFTATGLNVAQRAQGWDRRWTGRIPLARFAQPEEIAAACVFLASDDASYVTGHDFIVDGGLSAVLLPEQPAATDNHRGDAR